VKNSWSHGQWVSGPYGLRIFRHVDILTDCLWVSAHFTAKAVDGVTTYDLTAKSN